MIIETAGIKFVVDNEIERYRAETLLTKEPGTIQWLDRLGAGDVLYDVGANIGCYTLYAAKRGATVYAFEPHVGNAWKLMQNVAANGLGGKIEVYNIGLGQRRGEYQSFNYFSVSSGSSGSQMGHTFGEDGRLFVPVCAEMKWTAQLDTFLAFRPTALKIDVDGNEYKILQGAENLLRFGSALKTVQVEIHPGEEQRIQSFMANHGFPQTGSHYTSNGQKQLAAGVPAAQITYNGVFDRV
jgi:hypothetical protein